MFGFIVPTQGPSSGQRSISPLVQPTARIWPSGEKATLWPSGLAMAVVWPVRRSMMFTVRAAWPTAAERLHTAKELPSGEKARLTGVMPWLIDLGGCRLSRSQSTSSPVSNLLRYLPVPTANLRPSGETAMQLTAWLKVKAAATALRVLRSQTRTVLSTLPVNSLSVNNGATQVITPPWPCWPAGLPSPRRIARGL